MGQEFLGKGIRPAERQRLHSGEVEVRGVRACAFEGATRGQWSQLRHNTLRQLLMILAGCTLGFAERGAVAV